MSWNKLNLLRRIHRTSLWRTIYFNLKMLPFKQAIRFPILITSNTYFYSLSGKIELSSPPRFAMIRFGYFGEDTLHPRSNVSLLQFDGVIKLSDNVHFGNGLTIRVLPEATLTIKSNVKINNKTKIICYNDIIIGSDTRIAWDCQIFDTSFHYIRNIHDHSVSNMIGKISIGNHNWIGNRVSVMKGTVIPDYTIVGTNSLLNRDYDIPEYSLLAGSPAKLIKTGIYRCLDAEEKEIKDIMMKQN